MHETTFSRKTYIYVCIYTYIQLYTNIPNVYVTEHSKTINIQIYDGLIGNKKKLNHAAKPL